MFELESAYLLHRRPYRETSLLLYFLTKQHGFIKAIGRGLLRSKRHERYILKPFLPLLISWTGKNDLVTLKLAEPAQSSYCLSADKLKIGLYLNELLMRGLTMSHILTDVFELYEQTLEQIDKSQSVQPILRQFELGLLSASGYGIDFSCDAETHKPIQRDQFYSYIGNLGFVMCDVNNANRFSGHTILALSDNTLHHSQEMLEAKRLLRLLLKDILGTKPLKSRELFT